MNVQTTSKENFLDKEYDWRRNTPDKRIREHVPTKKMSTGQTYQIMRKSLIVIEIPQVMIRMMN